MTRSPQPCDRLPLMGIERKHLSPPLMRTVARYCYHHLPPCRAAYYLQTRDHELKVPLSHRSRSPDNYLTASVMADHDDAAIRGFEVKLQECTKRAYCGREYVLVQTLTNWLKSGQVGRLLAAVYPQQILPLYPDQVGAG